MDTSLTRSVPLASAATPARAAAHYSAQDLQRALESLPIRRGDLLFLHSNLGFFGRPEGVNDSATLCQMFFDALVARTGGTGTLVAPTFTYSFPRREVFDPVHSASAMGSFAEWLRLHPQARRSVDPNYSVAAIGPLAEALTADVSANSFDAGSFFARFRAHDGLILNLNFDAGSTFLHHLEREQAVSYRFDKTFEGTIIEKGRPRRAQHTIYVRHTCSDATEAVFEPFHALANEAGLFHSTRLGRGRMGCIRASDCEALLKATLPQRPWLLTRADALGAMPELVPEPDFQPL